MTKIAIASCCKIRGHKHQKVQTAWADIEAESPDLLLLLGDNVYMKQPGPRWKLDNLDEMYQLQFKEPHFASLIEKVPFMAIWDDHDFGPNDSRGASERDKSYRSRSRRIFHKHMSRSINNNRPKVYCSHVIDDIKVIMLDVRYYRTDIARVKRPTILGDKQENWLRDQLDHPHKYTVVGSGTCLTKGGKYDKWSAYKDAYARLKDMLDKVPKLIFMAGDLHTNKFLTHGRFFEVISSGVGRIEGGKPLNNYGIIDFKRSVVKVSLRGRHKIHRTIQTRSWKAD